MEIYRQLPKSDAQRKSALDKAAQKLAQTPPAEVILSADTIARLATNRTTFTNLLGTRSTAILARIQQVVVITLARLTAAKWLGSFILGFNEACDRGETGFALEDRAAYGLSISNLITPKMNTDTKLGQWGPRIIAGEADRVAAGGTAMPFPTIASVGTRYTNWVTQKDALIPLVSAANTAQEAVKNYHTTVDSFIKRMWNEIDAAYSEDPDPGSRRDKARAWGVVYVSQGELLTATGVVNPNGIAEVPPLEGIIPIPTLKVKIKNTTAIGSGVVLRFYFAAGPGLPPGMLYKDLEPGQEVEKEIQELGFALGIDALLVQNLSINAGTFSVSARVA